MDRRKLSAGPGEKREHYLTALEGEQVVGYIECGQFLDEGEITQVSVKRECQGRYIGRRLLEMLEEEGKRAGVASFFLEVRRSNAPAIHLYENCGFSVQGIRKNFMKIPERTAFSWRRKLPAIANSVFDSHWDL